MKVLWQSIHKYSTSGAAQRSRVYTVKLVNAGWLNFSTFDF